MLFSIIIPTFNRREALRSCLASLCQLDFDLSLIEVIVVDDGGQVELEDIVSAASDKLDISLIRQKNQGPAKARNYGSVQAKGQFLAFIDDDCLATKGWLQELFCVLEEHENVLVGGNTLNGIEKNIFSDASQELIHFLYSYYNADPLKAQFFTSNNMAISKALFDRINGFDVTTLKATAEDREICDRLLFLGYGLIHCETAVIHHYHDLSLVKLWRQHFNYGKGAFYFRKVRALRGQGKLEVEPFQFYKDLIFFPFKKGHNRSPLLMSFLLLVTQIANFLGFIYELTLRKMRGDSIVVKA